MEDLVAYLGIVWGAEVQYGVSKRGTPRPNLECGVHIMPRYMAGWEGLVSEELLWSRVGRYGFRDILPG